MLAQVNHNFQAVGTNGTSYWGTDAQGQQHEITRAEYFLIRLFADDNEGTDEPAPPFAMSDSQLDDMADYQLATRYGMSFS
jgi:mono/diheme cytochrome c family protein